MRESILQNYFVGTIGVEGLREDIQNAIEQTGHDSSRQIIIGDLTTDFEIEPAHLIKLCDDVLCDQLAAEKLEVIAFCLISSDHFVWNNENAQGRPCSGNTVSVGFS